MGKRKFTEKSICRYNCKDGVSKDNVINDIASFISEQIGLESTEIVEALNYRESEANTAVGDGIAIPHAIMENAKDSAVFLHLADHSVDWEAYDGKAVDIIFTLIVPKQEHDKSHLKQISMLACKLIDPRFQEFLRSETDLGKISKEIQLIQEGL